MNRPSQLTEGEHIALRPEHTDRINVIFQCEYGHLECYIFHADHPEEGLNLYLSPAIHDAIFDDLLTNNATEVKR